MITADLLVRLEAVRPRGAGRWSARCPVPGHGQGRGDQNPSLSVCEGEKALLLRCWAGCTLDEICDALQIQTRELFYDADPDPAAMRQRRHDRAARLARAAREHYVVGLNIDAVREAELLICRARNLDISGWSPERLDDALNTLVDAYAIIGREGTYVHE